MPGCEGIGPGQNKTFVFTITAPTTPGAYNFQWRMVHENITWFGDYTQNVSIQVLATPPANEVDDAIFIVQGVPSVLVAGEHVDVRLTMKNVGTTTWTARSNYFLGSQNTPENTRWGFNRIPLDQADSIGPGQEKSFTCTITAPSTPGTYNFQWRMVRDFVRWFGTTTANAAVTVQAAPASGAKPVAEWLFDDNWPPQTGSNTPTIDSSGSNTAYANGTTIVTGKAGYARAFASLNDWAYANASSALNISGTLTLEAWVNPTSRSTFSTIINKGPNSGSPSDYPGNYELGLDQSGYPHFRHETTAGVYDYTGTSPVPLNAWSHVAVAWGAGRVRFYVNGGLAADLPDNGEVALSSSPTVRIGRRSSTGGFIGSIDEVKIWNYARTTQQVLASFLPQTNCPAANPNDTIADDTALQSCLDQGGSVIRLKPGYPGYRVASGLTLSRDNVVITSTSTANRAVIMAAPTLADTMLDMASRNHIAISWIEFNGNRPARDLKLCCLPGSSGQNHRVENINVVMGATGAGAGGTMTNVAFTDNRSTQALSVSSVWLNGNTFELARNLIDNNGAGLEVGAWGGWSDGFTLGQCISGNVHNNTIVNATDIGIVDGGGPGCTISNNIIKNVQYNGMRRFAFAGTGLHVFCYSTTCSTDAQGHVVTDHTGTVLSANQVIAEGGSQAFGIMLGHHPWSPPDNPDLYYISGGSVDANAVTGAFVGLAVDGVKDLTVGANSLAACASCPTWWPQCGPTTPAAYTANSAHTLTSTLTGGWIERPYDGCIPARNVQGCVDYNSPLVTPPLNITITQTVCCGATSSTSPALASFLNGASATDDCDPSPTRLTPQLSGGDIGDGTCLPIGTSTVTFRYQDASFRLGAATAAVTVQAAPTPPTPTISAGGPTSFCTGSSVILTSSGSAGNQWYLNGGAIQGATSQQYIATAPGSYTVRVTVNCATSAASAPKNVTVMACQKFYTLTQCRMVDTRNPVGPLGGPALPANGSRTFALTGTCSIPSNAVAISFNITAVNEGANGSLRLYPAGIAPPVSSAISFSPWRTRANNGIAKVSSDGTASISVLNDSPATVDLLLDVNGFFR